MSLRCLVKVGMRGILRRFRNPECREELRSTRVCSDIHAQLRRSTVSAEVAIAHDWWERNVRPVIQAFVLVIYKNRLSATFEEVV